MPAPRWFFIVLFPAFFCMGFVTADPSFLVEPYLQDPRVDGMTVMWETTRILNRLEYWQDGQAHLTAKAQRVPGTQISFAVLSGLESNTIYSYRVLAGPGASPIYRFKTWPADSDPVTEFKMVALSDSQGDHPDRLQDICENGIIDKECTAGDAENCTTDLAAILIAGDLVHEGSDLVAWRQEFFGPCASLFHYVPLLPAIGNHDTPLDNYLAYFSLPANGFPDRQEECYFADHLNLRLVSMNSSDFAPNTWVWFHDLLNETVADGRIDFVVAQFHHPCKSEVWPPGENLLACAFIGWLEEFTRESGKPSADLFGHTHAYSRGQSRDVPHLWVNVGTSAGDIDYWDEYPQRDYPNFQVSYDEYGFSVLHFTRGADASFRLVRRTGGDDANGYGFTDETIQDDVSIEMADRPPDRPEAIYPADAAVSDPAVTLQASPFSDPDGDAHLESHWQVTSVPGDYTHPLVNLWGNNTRAQNVWKDMDTQAGADLTRVFFRFEVNRTYGWRVRYRDEHLVWSDWSQESTFSTVPPTVWAPASTPGQRLPRVPLQTGLVASFLLAAVALLILRRQARARPRSTPE